MNSERKSFAREPQQARGYQRIQTILDTCARLIAETGIASITMHGLATHSRTSIGSIYHFFPNKQKVLESLIHRHEETLMQVLFKLEEFSDESWKAFSVVQVIHHLVTPFFEYISENPDLAALMHPDFLRENSDVKCFNLTEKVDNIFLRVLKIRMPWATATEVVRSAYMIRAMTLGIVNLAHENCELRRDILMIDAPRAFTAYLTAAECDLD